MEKAAGIPEVEDERREQQRGDNRHEQRKARCVVVESRRIRPKVLKANAIGAHFIQADAREV